MAVRYNPWTGWGMGMAWSNGFFAVGVAFGYRGHPPVGWYPPGGYRPGGGGCYNCNIGIGNRPRPTPYRGTNLYNRPEVRDRTVASQVQRNREAQQLRADKVARGKNNVFTDRDGNVHRANGGVWEAPGVNGGWTRIEDAAAPARRANPTPAARPANPPGTFRPATPATRPAPTDLDREKAARDRGATRAASAPRVAFRGGGRRR